jgi:cellulose synthase/poly-beta-1,6-N-acetylglucosamine synthase-like glycosyltransferase
VDFRKHPIFVVLEVYFMKIIPELQDAFAFYTFWIFAGCVFVQFVYVILFFGRLAYKKNHSRDSNFPPVSVVIAARNESDNLFENLPKILNQDYPNFEVVVVNHQSLDDSRHLLAALQRDYKHLVVMEVERSKHLLPSKKLPLTLGIKKAKNEHLVLTDADCSPNSDQWLRRMVEQFSDKKQIVLGYGPYKTVPGFLNKLIRFDSTMIAVHYFSMALMRAPYMGVGRNMAYTKTVFDSTHGFKSHYSISSGDDDLFIQEAAKQRNYAVQLDPDSFMYSDAKSTWETFVLQKARHYTTSPRYKVFKKALLGIYPVTTLLLLISFIILLVQPEWRIHAGAGFALIWILKWWLLGKCFSRLKSAGYIALLPLLDIAYTAVMPFFYYSTLQKRTPGWK